jgi:hypothetical protein
MEYGFKEIRRLYRTAQMSKEIPGGKWCSWVTYRMTIVPRY